MMLRLIIQARENGQEIRSEVWAGDLEIKRDETYLAKISFLGDGEIHPIVDIPFALDIGWWEWHPAPHKETLVESEEKRLYG